VGGNTSCVLVELDDGALLILDLGTGLRYLGRDLAAGRDPDETFRATALISHLHWDHIQGIPFFAPLLRAGSDLMVLGPPQPGSSLGRELSRAVQPPLFPVSLADFPGEIRFHDATDEVLAVGSAKITPFEVPHMGPTNGYRIDASGGSLAYISDHQQPRDGSFEVPDPIVAACEGVDVLIHDAQFDESEFIARPDWGHCTPAFAAEVARRCGASRLVLFHHDPGHDDAWISRARERVEVVARGRFEVLAAYEGMRITSGL
jgi:ribonuclease BN (tRNA processing enzyme)